MTDTDGAQRAISELNSQEYGGRSLTVNEAKPMAPRGDAPRNFGGRQRREPRW
jgi:hypothetical protein